MIRKHIFKNADFMVILKIGKLLDIHYLHVADNSSAHQELSAG